MTQCIIHQLTTLQSNRPANPLVWLKITQISVFLPLREINRWLLLGGNRKLLFTKVGANQYCLTAPSVYTAMKRKSYDESLSAAAACLFSVSFSILTGTEYNLMVDGKWEVLFPNCYCLTGISLTKWQRNGIPEYWNSRLVEWNVRGILRNTELLVQHCGAKEVLQWITFNAAANCPESSCSTVNNLKVTPPLSPSHTTITVIKRTD